MILLPTPTLQMQGCSIAMDGKTISVRVINLTECFQLLNLCIVSTSILVSRALYPPVTSCSNPLCFADDKTLRSTSKSPRKVILYTLEDGACATYHFKLHCAGKFLFNASSFPWSWKLQQSVKRSIITIIQFTKGLDPTILEFLKQLRLGNINLLHGTLPTYS